MADIIDRNESLGLLEPLLISETSKHRGILTDLALELAIKSTALSKSLASGVAESLSTLVRSMNCYYSNLIEGHDTHPVDIEKALKGDYSENPSQRNLQLEAKAHISVQSWIDEGGLQSRASSNFGVQEIHRRFCELLPEELLLVEDPESKERFKVVPGEFRHKDVKVGAHVPVSPGSINRFMDRFEGAYRSLGKTDKILSAASAHHRFLYIHPFLDGNGRVARLMSYAILKDPLDTDGIWSIARGLARNESTYKNHLSACDQKRRNDLDGRGHLSEESLVNFTKFFLETCIDQVNFMEKLVQPERLKSRILSWANIEFEQGFLPPHSKEIIEAILYRGQLSKTDAQQVIGKTERQTRRVVSALLDIGILTSKDIRSPLKLAFPAALASDWMPGLFPDK